MSPMHAEHLSWTALLGKWVQFAQASMALPKDAEGERWRESVPSIINLQAVTFALADLDRVMPDDRPVALDKAELLVRQHTEALQRLWHGSPPPPMLRELCDDAQRAVHSARMLLDQAADPDISA